MKRHNLHKSPGQELGELIRAARSAGQNGETTPFGNKYMPDGSDIWWFDADGHERSMRDLDREMSQLDGDLAANAEELAAAQGRLEKAREALDAGLVRIEKADAGLKKVEADLAGGLKVIGKAEESLTALTGDLSELDSRLTQEVSKAVGDAAAARAAGDAAHALASQASQDAAAANNAAAKAWEQATAVSLLPDGDFPSGSSQHWRIAPSAARSNWYANPFSIGKPALQPVYDSIVSVAWSDVPVTPGRVVRIRGEAINGRVRLAGSFITADGRTSFVPWTSWQDGGTTKSPAAVTGDVVVPAGATLMQVSFQHDGSQNAYWISCHAWDVTDAVAAEKAADEAREAAQEALEKASSSLIPALGDSSFRVGGANASEGTGPTGRASVKLTPTSSKAVPTYTSDMIVVQPGRVYVAEVTAKVSGGYLSLAGSFVGDPGSFVFDRALTESTFSNVSATGRWQTHRHIFRLSEGAKAPVPLYMWVRAYASAGQTLEVASFRLMDVTAEQLSRDAWSKSQEATEKAAQALASAQGGNHIITSLYPARGIINPTTGGQLTEGDVWWQVDSWATRQVIGQWVWASEKWQITEIRSELIANLDVSKLTVSGSARMTQAVVDKIIGDAAHFGLLTAEKVLVGVDNLVPNGNYARLGPSGMPIGFEFGSSSWRWRPDWYGGAIQVTGASGAWTTQLPFEATAGTTYRGSVTVWAQADGAKTYIQMMSADPSAPNEYVVSGAVVGRAATVLSWEWTPKTSGLWRIRIFPNHSSGAASDYMLYGPFAVKPKVGGELLVDGSIGARQIKADEVAGAVGTFLKLDVNQLVATGTSTLNAVVAQKIAAGTGQFLQLDVGQLTATKTSTLNDVVAQQIAARSGQFLSLDVGQLTATGTTNLDQAVAQRIAAGTAAFQQVYAENLVAGSGTFRDVVVEKLATQMIASGMFVAGDRYGSRVEITGAGLTAFNRYGSKNVSLGSDDEFIWVGESENYRGRPGVGMGNLGPFYGLLFTSANSSTDGRASVISVNDGEVSVNSAPKWYGRGQQHIVWVNPDGAFMGRAGINPQIAAKPGYVEVGGFRFPEGPVDRLWGALPDGLHTVLGSAANVPIAGRTYSMLVRGTLGGAKTFIAVDDIEGRLWTAARTSDGRFTPWKAAN